jgi:hypothetical protein
LGWQPVLPETIAAIRSCPGRLYNRYDEGGYLIWFVRDRKVFIDSRQDPFPEPLVRAHIDLERSGEYQALFARYDIGCALSAAGTPWRTVSNATAGPPSMRAAGGASTKSPGDGRQSTLVRRSQQSGPAPFNPSIDRMIARSCDPVIARSDDRAASRPPARNAISWRKRP